ncbi:MAG: STAS/SEC14 domain-containing protein [Sneathiella sp.]|uniref:STAS/SEC14 domain-containing protein n=1 Tax=Sneathiella sp. TaxID=1964365 RepID=UPI0030036CE5
MITVEKEKTGNILRAEVAGKIEVEDWDNVLKAIDPIVAEKGTVRLFLDASDFAGWKDLDAARAHFTFVKLHHENVDRIALIVDHHWQGWLAGIAEIFVDTEIRTFEEDQKEVAESWLSNDEQSSFSILASGVPDIIGLKINDKLTGEDYEKSLLPLLNELISQHGKIKLYVDMSGFNGMEISAFWQDFNFGIRNWSHFDRMAVVGMRDWMEAMTKLMSAIIPVEMKMFDVDERDEAWDWIKS